jgi:hypothetical protein
VTEEFTIEERKLIVRTREAGRYFRTHPSPWVRETLGLIDGTLRRVWKPNPHYMTPGEPVGRWETEERK